MEWKSRMELSTHLYSMKMRVKICPHEQILNKVFSFSLIEFQKLYKLFSLMENNSIILAHHFLCYQLKTEDANMRVNWQRSTLKIKFHIQEARKHEPLNETLKNRKFTYGLPPKCSCIFSGIFSLPSHTGDAKQKEKVESTNQKQKKKVNK